MGEPSSAGASRRWWWTRLSLPLKVAVAGLTVGIAAWAGISFATGESYPQCYTVPLAIEALIPAFIAGLSVLIGAWIAVRIASSRPAAKRLVVAIAVGAAGGLAAFVLLSVVRFFSTDPFVVPGCLG